MYQGTIRVLVACIILGGHFLVFFAGLLLGIFGPLLGVDVVQTILMASPVLGVTASSALMFAMRGQTEIDRGEKVTTLFSTVTLFFPIALLVCIAVVFVAISRQVNGFGPDQLKISLGAIETFFGIFLGTIAQTLFGTKGENPSS